MNYTQRLRLQYPNVDDESWNAPMESDLAALDATFLGNFAVVPAEIPSITLNYLVRGGSYVGTDGLIHAVSDYSVQSIPASSTKYVYVKSDGTLGIAAAWPAPGAGQFHPLAIVTSGTASITSIVDARYPLRLMGS